jgi:hypothetical protein
LCLIGVTGWRATARRKADQSQHPFGDLNRPGEFRNSGGSIFALLLGRRAMPPVTRAGTARTRRQRGSSVAVYCGIDWAEGHQEVALVESDGTMVARRRITESLDGSRS